MYVFTTVWVRLYPDFNTRRIRTSGWFRAGVPAQVRSARTLFVSSACGKLTVKCRPKRHFFLSFLSRGKKNQAHVKKSKNLRDILRCLTQRISWFHGPQLGEQLGANWRTFKLLWILVSLKMPVFELSTNVKEVPAEFHQETTNLIAELLGKPSSVSVHWLYYRLQFRIFQVCSGSYVIRCQLIWVLSIPLVTFAAVIWVIASVCMMIQVTAGKSLYLTFAYSPLA